MPTYLGKHAGSKIWIHRSYGDELVEELALPWLSQLFGRYWKNLWERNYEILRLDLREESAAFIRCWDFDNSPEPVVGESLRLGLGQHPDTFRQYSLTKGGSHVYHHRHLFVGEDYKGFDQEESRRRRFAIEELKNEGLLDSRRMGGRLYWQAHVHLVEERLRNG